MVEPSRNALDLPPAFIRNNREHPNFLRGLPDRLVALAARWSLTLGPPFPTIRINYVAPAIRADGTQAVLKVNRSVDETRSEIAALRLWNGNGAARLLEAAPAIGALLLERLTPGTMLDEVADSDD